MRFDDFHQPAPLILIGAGLFFLLYVQEKAKEEKRDECMALLRSCTKDDINCVMKFADCWKEYGRMYKNEAN